MGIAEFFDGLSTCISEFPGFSSSDVSLEDLSLAWTPIIEQSALYRDRIWRKSFIISGEEAASSSELDGLTRGNWEIYSSRCRMCWEARLPQKKSDNKSFWESQLNSSSFDCCLRIALQVNANPS
jgi:hypothetical protein